MTGFDETAVVEGSGTFRRLELARIYCEADVVINLPKLKTHEMMTLTCGVKTCSVPWLALQKRGCILPPVAQGSCLPVFCWK